MKFFNNKRKKVEDLQRQVDILEVWVEADRKELLDIMSRIETWDTNIKELNEEISLLKKPENNS